MRQGVRVQGTLLQQVSTAVFRMIPKWQLVAGDFTRTPVAIDSCGFATTHLSGEPFVGACPAREPLVGCMARSYNKFQLPFHFWPIVSRAILPQTNIDKGFDMTLNSCWKGTIYRHTSRRRR